MGDSKQHADLVRLSSGDWIKIIAIVLAQLAIMISALLYNERRITVMETTQRMIVSLVQELKEDGKARDRELRAWRQQVERRSSGP